MCTLIPEILSVDLNSHCKNCPYHNEQFSYKHMVDNVELHDVIANKYISNDLEKLQKYYTVLLNYYDKLNAKCNRYQNEIKRLKKGIKYDEMRDKTYSE